MTDVAVGTRYVITDPKLTYDGGPGHDGLIHDDIHAVRAAAKAAGRPHDWARYGEPTAFTQAAESASYQLSFRRSPEQRRFHRGGLTGPRIDCAFDPDGYGAGDWEEPEAWMRPVDEDTDQPLPDPTTVEQWHETFFATAVAEAVHEACEWFKVDGQTVVNPHAPHLEDVCYDAAVAAARTMWAHAHSRPAPDPQVRQAPPLDRDGLDVIRRRLAATERQTQGHRCIVEVDRSLGRKRTTVQVDDEHGSVLADIVWDEGYADFVAHAPEDMAALLAEVDRLKAALAASVADAER